MYCDRLKEGWPTGVSCHRASQTTIRPCRAQGRVCDMATHPTTRPGATAKTRPGVRAPGRACAHLFALAGPGWVLCAPDLVFDPVFYSVLFLSHRLDTVHGHCSSQKKF